MSALSSWKALTEVRSLSSLARALSRGRLTPETYAGALAGLIPVDAALSYLAKRSYPAYRLWQEYGRVTDPYFARRGEHLDQAAEPAHVAALDADGAAACGTPFADADVREARAWVEERAEDVARMADRRDPAREHNVITWRDGPRSYYVDRRLARVRFFLDGRDPEASRWPRLVRAFLDVRSIRAAAQEHFRTDAVLTGNPYCMAEVMKQGSDNEPWHIDCVRPSLKAFLYLNDVSPAQGPLRYVPGTHHLDEERHRLFFRICNGGLGHAYPDQAAHAELNARAMSACGPAGTLTLFDTHTLHAGSLCTVGERVALVNGYRPLTTTRLHPRVFEDPAPQRSPWEY